MNLLTHIELDSLRYLYRQETKKLFQAICNGTPWPQLDVQKQLLEHLRHRIGAY